MIGLPHIKQTTFKGQYEIKVKLNQKHNLDKNYQFTKQKVKTMGLIP